MAHEHKSGIPGAHDRAEAHPEWQGAVFVGDRFIQAAELNDAQTIARNRHNRVANMTAKDGDRTEGGAAIYNPETEQLILTAGRIFVRGDIFPVATRIIEDVPATGLVEIGIRVTTTYPGPDTMPALRGLLDGSDAQDEPGSHREVVSIAWALSDDAGAGDFVSVYGMRDGTVIDQTAPPLLSGFSAAMSGQDYGAHGNYIVKGCRVTALGKLNDDQVFSIEEGEANILGYKRTRMSALRFAAEEDFETEEVAGEPHTWPTGSTVTFTTNRRPIDALNAILVTKQVTVSVTRGSTAGGADTLPHNSVSAIISVVQGGTTYVAGTSYTRVGDTVSWAPAGAEPTPGSSYNVTLQYLAITTPDSWNDTSITLSGGVAGTTVILGYDFKLPRVDMLCLDQSGEAVYVKGISARESPLPPVVPSSLLRLAEVTNSWMGKPEVKNSGIRSVPYDELWGYIGRIIDHERLLQLERIKSGIDSRELTAKKGIFVDPFTSDFYRDAGEPQTASVGNGILELAITPTFFVASLSAPLMLDYVEEVIISQELVTNCLLINPYMVFTPMPAGLSITPAADFWVEKQTIWTSPATIEFNRGFRFDNGPLVVSTASTQTAGDPREQQAEFLRPISVAFHIKGFGNGEILTSLTFDGIDVKPAGTITAGSDGTIDGTFTIPSNIPAGSKRIRATGGSGAQAAAAFVGNGVIETTVLRSITTIERWDRPVVVMNPGSGGSDRETESWGGWDGSDPLAQTFMLNQTRHIVGVDFRLCGIGDTDNSLLVHQVGVEVGLPNSLVVAEAFVPMTGAVVGWKSARYHFPVVTGAQREAAFVVKTDDAAHALSTAKLGQFDAANQQWVGAQPYTTGVLLSSSNARTWTPHNDEDLAFRVVAARFPVHTKTVTLGSYNLVGQSDFQVRADAELPSADCSVVFELVRPGGAVYRLLPYQVLQLPEAITETVQLRVILTGTETLSPILYAPVVFIAGALATTGTYVTRAMNLGTAVTLTPYYKAMIPAGATVTIEYDLANDSWVSLPLITTEQLADPRWVERKHEAAGITATQGRLKFTITGGPGARPRVGDFGAAIA